VTSLVTDASALVEHLLGTERGATIGHLLTEPSADLHVPALCDVEVASALRRLLHRKVLSKTRAQEALEDYLDLPLTWHGHRILLPRCFALRDVLSAYDATYVALAERLAAPLLTTDARLASAARKLGIPSLPA
jgi:predicted nucleic acid-binding protein